MLRFNKRWSSAKVSAGTSNTAADVVMLHDLLFSTAPHFGNSDARLVLQSVSVAVRFHSWKVNGTHIAAFCGIALLTWTVGPVPFCFPSHFHYATCSLVRSLGAIQIVCCAQIATSTCWGGVARCQTPPRWHWIGPRRCRWHKTSINQRQTNMCPLFNVYIIILYMYNWPHVRAAYLWILHIVWYCHARCAGTLTNITISYCVQSCILLCAVFI